MSQQPFKVYYLNGSGAVMKLRLSNLGPIKHGEIELGDITLFVGKPSTGKSTAMRALFYSLYCPENLIELKGYPLEVRDNLFLQRFAIDREETEKKYKSFVRDSLPEGEFKLEPINFLDFVLTRKLSYEEKYRPISLPPMYFSNKCRNKDIERLRFSLSKAIYEITVNGDEGEVKVEADITDVKQTCLENYETRSSLSRAFMMIAQERVSSQYCEGFNEFLRERGINGVVYIPYGRSFLVLQKFIIQEILSYFKSSLLELDLKFLVTRPNYLMEYYMGLSTYNEKIFNLIKPLLKGQVRYLGEKLVYVEEDKIIPWKYVSASVLEIVSFLLSVKEGSLVLFEEPETQLHEELQLLMGIVLYALSSFNRIVISTHSQTILYTIAHLSMLRPTKEELKDLFEDLNVKDFEALAEAVEKANQKEVKVKIYHFTEGEVKEVSVDEAVKGMPGTIDVLEKGLKWLSSLHSKRLFGEG